jgi:glycosyltransferase involved in cell wall biosynthesis
MTSKRSKKLHILLISQHFPPEIGAAAARVSELADALQAKGHRISVVTEFPNYPNGIIQDHHRGKLFLRERFNNIDVIRTFVYASERGTLFQRMLFYLSFMVSSIFGGMLVKDYDLILATSPPLFVALSGYLLSLFRGRKFIFEVRDIWPESAKSLHQLRGKPFIWIAEKLELFLYRRASRIIVVTRGFIKDLLSKGVPREKLVLISNGVDVEFFKPRPRANYIAEKYGLDNRFVVSYTGNLGLAQGIDTIIESAELVKDQKDIVFMLIGDGVVKKNVMASAKNKGLSNIIFVGTQPKSEISAFLSVADVCLVPLKKTQLFKITVPSKLYESMACGKTVVLSVDGEARQILADAQAGIFVEPENAQAMAAAILELHSSPQLLARFGVNGRIYVVENYARSAQAETLEKVLLGASAIPAGTFIEPFAADCS